MAEPNAVPQIADWALATFGGFGAMVAGFFAYRRDPKTPDPSKDVAVVSASLFSDRQLIMDWMTETRSLRKTLECTNELLEADAQRRHDEAVVREALAKRGIIV